MQRLQAFCTLRDVNRTVWLIALAFACKRDDPAAPAKAAAQALVQPVDAGFVLTPELLDRYLKVTRAFTAPSKDDGGVLSPLEVAEFQQRALVEAGITDVELAYLDEMVSMFVARRMSAGLADKNFAAPELNAMGAGLTAEQRRGLQDAIANFKQAQRDGKSLKAERLRYGSKNIDVLLSREADVMKTWGEQMSGAAAMPQLPPGLTGPGQ